MDICGVLGGGDMPDFDPTGMPPEEPTFPPLPPNDDRSISKVYPEELTQPPTVTVWYNNGVSAHSVLMLLTMLLLLLLLYCCCCFFYC